MAAKQRALDQSQHLIGGINNADHDWFDAITDHEPSGESS